MPFTPADIATNLFHIGWSIKQPGFIRMLERPSERDNVSDWQESVIAEFTKQAAWNTTDTAYNKFKTLRCKNVDASLTLKFSLMQTSKMLVEAASSINATLKEPIKCVNRTPTILASVGFEKAVTLLTEHSQANIDFCYAVGKLSSPCSVDYSHEHKLAHVTHMLYQLRMLVTSTASLRGDTGLKSYEQLFNEAHKRYTAGRFKNLYLYDLLANARLEHDNGCRQWACKEDALSIRTLKELQKHQKTMQWEDYFIAGNISEEA